jgi:hypothetical protein
MDLPDLFFLSIGEFDTEKAEATRPAMTTETLISRPSITAFAAVTTHHTFAAWRLRLLCGLVLCRNRKSKRRHSESTNK